MSDHLRMILRIFHTQIWHLDSGWMLLNLDQGTQNHPVQFLFCCTHILPLYRLPKTNIKPKNGCLEEDLCFQRPDFRDFQVPC